MHTDCPLWSGYASPVIVLVTRTTSQDDRRGERHRCTHRTTDLSRWRVTNGRGRTGGRPDRRRPEISPDCRDGGHRARPRLRVVDIVHRGGLEVHLLLHGRVGPRRCHEARSPLEREGRSASGRVQRHIVAVVRGAPATRAEPRRTGRAQGLRAVDRHGFEAGNRRAPGMYILLVDSHEGHAARHRSDCPLGRLVMPPPTLAHNDRATAAPDRRGPRRLLVCARV